MSTQDLYDAARRHGLSHERALEAVAKGELHCWCGSTRVCDGGAQRFVGCPVDWDRFLDDVHELQRKAGRGQ